MNNTQTIYTNLSYSCICEKYTYILPRRSLSLHLADKNNQTSLQSIHIQLVLCMYLSNIPTAASHTHCRRRWRRTFFCSTRTSASVHLKSTVHMLGRECTHFKWKFCLTNSDKHLQCLTWESYSVCLSAYCVSRTVCCSILNICAYMCKL